MNDELTRIVVPLGGCYHLRSLRVNDTERTQCGLRIARNWRSHKLTPAVKANWRPCLRCFPEERER